LHEYLELLATRPGVFVRRAAIDADEKGGHVKSLSASLLLRGTRSGAEPRDRGCYQGERNCRTMAAVSAAPESTFLGEVIVGAAPAASGLVGIALVVIAGTRSPSPRTRGVEQPTIPPHFPLLLRSTE
jgi:hypothetical protein